jgi:multiple sugar transport system permease protein
MRRLATSAALHGILVVWAALTLLPLVWMVGASLMPAGEASSLPPRLWPSEPTLAHYRDLFARLHLARHFGNSFFLAGTIMLVSLVVNAMAGYALAKLRFPGREGIVKGLTAALVVPGQIGMLPLFLLLDHLGLIDTYAAVIVPGIAGIFGIMLVRQHALSLPDSILDAARTDGAGEFRVFRSVVVRLAAPILVALAVFTFLGAWNDFLWPLIVLADDRRYPLPVALAALAGEHVQDVELMMAGAVLTILPVVLVFVALQRFYLAGITAGGVKE